MRARNFGASCLVRLPVHLGNNIFVIRVPTPRISHSVFRISQSVLFFIFGAPFVTIQGIAAMENVPNNNLLANLPEVRILKKWKSSLRRCFRPSQRE